MSCHSI